MADSKNFSLDKSEKDFKCILKLLDKCENDPHNHSLYHFAIAHICIRHLKVD